MTENIVNLNAPIQNAYLLLTESENRIELYGHQTIIRIKMLIITEVIILFDKYIYKMDNK